MRRCSRMSPACDLCRERPYIAFMGILGYPRVYIHRSGDDMGKLKEHGMWIVLGIIIGGVFCFLGQATAAETLPCFLTDPETLSCTATRQGAAQ